ncbi:MAG: hypothetical protein KAT68_17485 [Bacteroidales bacterium]|nr:hypothetical protein [Bacteroidales bacterium]
MKAINYLLISLGIFIFLNTNNLLAQDEYDFYNDQSTVQQRVDNFFPPSPTASALGKYAEIPVKTYTGVPQINIPIYNIEVRNLSLPISLSYHSSGIKVEEEASWVGLGWSLNAGGVITRTVKGLPDDLYGTRARTNEKYYRPVYDEVSSYNQVGYFYNTWINDLYNDDIFGDANYDKINELGRGAKDGEPDMFYFNFAGYTGKFVFDNNRTAHLLPQQKIKIEFEQTNENGNIDSQGLISKFTITIEDGTKYHFEAIERTKVWQANSDYSDLLYFNPYLDLEYDESTFEYNSSWYLTKIESETGIELITFTYTDEDILRLDNTQHISCLEKSSNSQSVTEISSKRLMLINWLHGHIDFYAGHIRQDIDPAYTAGPYFNYHPEENSQDSKALSQILVFKNNSAVPIRIFDFNYEYFNAELSSPESEYYLFLEFSNKRLKLNSVTESDVDGDSKPPYTFKYNESINLPFRYSFTQDFWGYNTYYPEGANYNFVPTVYIYPDDNEFISKYGTRYCIYNRDNCIGRKIIIPGGDWNANEEAMQANILTQINYPTGGYSRFEYEAHKFYFEGELKTGGGLRIKRNIHSDGITEQIKEYYYELLDGTSTGKIIYIPQFACYNQCYGNCCPDPNCSSYWETITKIFSRSQGGLGSTQGSHIGYTNVTIETNGIGKIVYEYDLPATYEEKTYDCDDNGENCIYNRTETYITPPYINGWVLPCYNHINLTEYCLFPFPPNPNYDWNRGKLLSEKYYDTNNNPVKDVRYYYNENQDITYNIIKAIAAKTALFDVDAYGIISTRYKFGKYYYISAWKHPTKTITTTYGKRYQEEYITEEIEYFYDNSDHMQLSRKTKTESEGDKVVTQTLYPDDYSGTTGFIGDMKTAHIINQPVEKTIYKTDENGENIKILSGEIYTYKNGTKAGLLDGVYALETANPILKTDFKFSNMPGVNMLPHENIENNTEFLLTNIDGSYSQTSKIAVEYDDYGNVIQTQKAHDIPISYIWGYNNTYPIAKVVNATYAEIEGVFSEAELTSLNTETLSDEAMRTLLNKLRTPSLTDVQVTTYTYDPLIGITSETNIQGVITYYDYDDFGRLETIKDDNGNILKHVEYNYAEEE